MPYCFASVQVHSIRLFPVINSLPQPHSVITLHYSDPARPGHHTEHGIRPSTGRISHRLHRHHCEHCRRRHRRRRRLARPSPQETVRRPSARHRPPAGGVFDPALPRLKPPPPTTQHRAFCSHLPKIAIAARTASGQISRNM